MSNIEGILIICVWVQSQLVSIVFLYRFEVEAFMLHGQELLMHDLEGITDGVVLSLEGPEARQN